MHALFFTITEKHIWFPYSYLHAPPEPKFVPKISNFDNSWFPNVFYQQSKLMALGAKHLERFNRKRCFKLPSKVTAILKKKNLIADHGITLRWSRLALLMLRAPERVFESWMFSEVMSIWKFFSLQILNVSKLPKLRAIKPKANQNKPKFRAVR